MIHHISIGAQNPLRVAHVLAEVWNGMVFAFFPNPGGYLVNIADDYGTAVEVYPIQDQLVPGLGEEPCQFVHQANVREFGGIHAAISVPIPSARIKQIGAREGWRVVTCDRGVFKIIEFWVENRFLLDLTVRSSYKNLYPEKLSGFRYRCRPEYRSDLQGDYFSISGSENFALSRT